MSLGVFGFQARCVTGSCLCYLRGKQMWRPVQQQVTVVNVTSDPLTHCADRFRSCGGKKKSTEREMTADCLICRDSLNLRINSSDPRSGNISRTGQTGANRNCRGKIQGTQSRAQRRRRVPVTARLLWLLRERGSRLEKKMKSTESQAVCGCETWPGRYRLQVHQRSSVAQHQSYLASLCHSVERIPMVTPHGVFNLHVTPVGIATEGGEEKQDWWSGVLWSQCFWYIP